MPTPDKSATSQQARRMETLGLIIITLLILTIALTRYGRHISWSWR